ncbi:unnamed protein product, partial [Nesidiocoris tenuis]
FLNLFVGSAEVALFSAGCSASLPTDFFSSAAGFLAAFFVFSFLTNCGSWIGGGFFAGFCAADGGKPGGSFGEMPRQKIFTAEHLRERRRETHRRRSELRRTDPELRKIYLEKERLRYQKRKMEGSIELIDKKSFACKYCEKQFTLQSNMKRHIKMKHLPPALARLSSFINVVEGVRRVNLCRWRSLHLPQVRDSGGDQVPHFAPKFSCRNPSSANGYLWTRCDGTFEGFQRIMPGGRPRKAVAQSREEKLKEKRKAEQRRRERIRTNPEEYEKYKESERERYQKRKQKGYFKTADQLSKAALEERRKAVRERVRMHRNRKRALQDFLDRCRIYVGPPETPQHDNGNFQQIKREPVDENQPAVPSIQAAPGPSWKELWRKHERREIAKLRRKLEKEKKRADENCRRMREYKKLWQREVARHQVEGDGTPQGIAEG